MMGRDGIVSQTLTEVQREPLDHAPRGHENQRRTMRSALVREPIVELCPLLVRAYGAELFARNVNGQLDVATIARIDDLRQRTARTDQETRGKFDRAHGRGQTHTLRTRAPTTHDEFFEAFERKRQMRATFVGRNGMDFIHDDRAHIGERATTRC